MTDVLTAGHGSALSGVRVLDLGHGVAGPFAARLLGDLGADVVKVERAPGGDFLRTVPPFVQDTITRASTSAIYEYVNWNKRGIVVDLADPGQRQTVRDLASWADIVISSFRPSRLAQWRLTADTFLGWNPRVVVVTVTNFGMTGEYASWGASDLVLQAMAGVMQISGTTNAEPLKPGLHQSLYLSSMNVAYTALAALYGARRSGRGTHVDVSMHECLASQLVVNQPLYAFTGVIQGRRPPVEDPLGGKPLVTADGFVSIQTNPLTPTARLSELVGDDRLADPKYATPSSRVRHADELTELLHDLLVGVRSRDFFVTACRNGHLAGVVQAAQDLVRCEQLQARGVFHSFDELRAGGHPVRFPAVFASLSQTPVRVRCRAPRLGQHTGNVLAELRARRPATGSAPAADRPGGGPFDGLRILDLSTVFAVPYMGALLRDLGAEVIKIEAPRRLDQSRIGFGATFDNQPHEDYWDRATSFQVLNRGKRSAVLDLASEAGREVLCDLVRRCDVLLDNFTPRVMRQWNTTFDELRALNPSLIMLSNTGYGSSGPWSQFKAQGTTLEATMGLTAYTGYPGGPPAKAGQSYPDFIACWLGLTALTAALIYRQATGIGQWIDLGMYQLGLMVIPEALLTYQITGADVPRIGNQEPGTFLSRVFRASGEDRWLALSLPDRGALTAMRRVVDGLPEIAESVPDSMAADLVSLRVAEWAAARDASRAAMALQEAGLAAGPVMDARDLLLDRHLAERGFYEQADFGPGVGPRPLIGRPYRWSGCDAPAIRGPAPRYAEGNSYVLRDVLGYGENRAHRLYATDVVVDRPIDPVPVQPWDLELMLRTGALARLDPDYRATISSRRDAVP